MGIVQIVMACMGTATSSLVAVCLILLIGGLSLLCNGILGQYLAKTYLETKSRPIYITGETEEMYRKRINEQEN